MSKVNYATVICSQEYQALFYSVLEKNDVLIVNTASAEDVCLNDFVKKNTSGISNFDAIIIDLGVLTDTDEKIIESIEMLRFYDDKMRIIIFEGRRPNSYKLLHTCFLNGVYNLIIMDTFIDIRNNLKKCICQGMSYKEASLFRSEENLFKKAEEPLGSQKKTLVYTGTQNRVGVTHCVISAAYALRSYGYLVAVVDCTGSTDYVNIMHSYEKKLGDDLKFPLEEIDFFIKPASSECISPSAAYNFIIYDMGHYGRISALNDSEKEIYKSAEEKVLVCGSKPWEIPYLSQIVGNMADEEKESMKFLFNLTESALKNDIKKMMKQCGIKEDSVHFMDYIEMFQENRTVIEMFGVTKNKRKKRLFRRKNSSGKDIGNSRKATGRSRHGKGIGLHRKKKGLHRK